jgi:uncharacterized protein with FMN-binding domain
MSMHRTVPRKIALTLVVAAASGAYALTLGRQPVDDLLLAPASAAGTPLVVSPPAGNKPAATSVSELMTTTALRSGWQDAPATVAPTAPAAPPSAPQPTPAVAMQTQPSSSTPALDAQTAVAMIDTPPAPRPQPPMPRLSPYDGAPPPVVKAKATAANASPPVIKAAAKVAASGQYADGVYTGPAIDAYYGIVQIQAIVQNGRLAAIKVLRYPSDRRTSVAINRQALPMLRDEVISAQTSEVDIISGATFTSEGFILSLRGALGGARA